MLIAKNSQRARHQSPLRRLSVLPAIPALFAAAVVCSAQSPDTSGEKKEEATVTTNDTANPPSRNPRSPEAKPAHTNRLIHATSPYLLQHAHNPVDWYEWSDEAFARAKKENKPVFLSIGYAACHWCHVMEHESFELEEVAAVLNASFVCIKVDREERPDIDEIYMTYTQQTTGSGGWPMSVWLTPDGSPFFAGTYFPKPQFLQLLGQISESWKTQQEQILTAAAGAKRFFQQWAKGPPPADTAIPLSTVDATATLLAEHFDKSRGGMASGSTNKFPPSMAMELMLRVYRRTKQSGLFEAVEVTLDHMASGGIYDHIGGGICRYSTDRDWLVPHFEKMLYDQALVSSVYLDAFQLTRHDRWAAVAADIFDYVIDDLQSEGGGFFSSRDADSEGLEGAFYIWTVEEVEALLGEKEADLCRAYFDISPDGNWFERMGHAPKGPKNILHTPQPRGAFAKSHGLTVEKLDAKIQHWRETLRSARAKRVPPALDDKILTGWNGLMIASLAKGARVLDEPKYAVAAAKSADFLLDKLQVDGRLLRTYRNGQARLTGYLSDYAFLIDGLLNLYEATFDRRRLDTAAALTDTVIQHYLDKQHGGFFFSANDGETLIARGKSPNDGAIPSGNSVMAMNLLRLSVLTGRKDLRKHAESAFRAFAPYVDQNAVSFERLLCAVDFHHDRVKEIAIVGDADAAETKALLRTVFDRYLPNKVVVFAAGATDATDIPLLIGKARRNGKPTAFVCENYTCKAPVTETAELAKLLVSKSKK